MAKVTKAELITEIKRKAQKAKLMVRTIFTSGLNRRSKKELQRLAKGMRVTNSGDIYVN